MQSYYLLSFSSALACMVNPESNTFCSLPTLHDQSGGYVGQREQNVLGRRRNPGHTVPRTASVGRLSQARSQRTGLEVPHDVQDAKDNGVDAEQPDQGDQPGIGPDGDKNAEDDRDDPGQP